MGIQAQTQLSLESNSVLLGLGFGFLAIFVINAIVTQLLNMWWALLVGAILLAIGVFQNTQWLQILLRAWPIVLILLGLSLLIRVVRRNPARRGDNESQIIPERSSPVTSDSGDGTHARR